jgi:aminoglycoside 3-N-acetyltransferase
MLRVEPLDVVPKAVKELIARTFFSFGPDDVVEKLRELGIRVGDTVMVHSSWRPNNGFRGRPTDMVSALQQSVGPRGLLVMPSLTYQNKSSREFLANGTPMDVRRSPSKMGLLTEVFRRTAGVERSLSPTHPLLAWGADAKTFLADHDRSLIPFAEDSPFGRLLSRQAKILTIDAAFSTITFTHFAECRIAGSLPFPLLDPDPLLGRIVDYAGRRREVPVRVITELANALRRDQRLEDRLRRQGSLRTARLGRIRLLCVDCTAITNCAEAMAAEGSFFFDTPGSA